MDLIHYGDLTSLMIINTILMSQPVADDLLVVENEDR